MKVLVADTRGMAVRYLANDMFETVKGIVDGNLNRAVVLPTGSTYEGEDGVYRHFADKVKAVGLDLTDFPFFNMDAYLQRTGRKSQLLNPEDELGYQWFMKNELFDRLGIQPQNHHFPRPDPLAVEHRDGSLCSAYTEALKAYGFAARVYGGIGAPVPHIAFNPPGSKDSLKARVVRLSTTERQTNADIYDRPLSDIPEYAASIGMWEIFKSDSVALAAFGVRKAEVVARCVYNPDSNECPAGHVLHTHSEATLICDLEAAAHLDASSYQRI